MKEKDLASLTTTVINSLLFYLTVCWVIPFIPMMMSLMLGWELWTFLEIWLIGILFSTVTLAALYMKRKAS
jgi:hypothetical protein